MSLEGTAVNSLTMGSPGDEGKKDFGSDVVGGVKGILFRLGWGLFFSGIPLLHWSAPGLLLILIHWAVARPKLAGEPPRLYRVAVYGMLAAYGISIIPAVNRWDALGESIGFGLLLLFGLQYAFQLEAARTGWWRRYIWLAPITGTGSALVGLYQNIVIHGRPLFEGRMVGVHTNPNAYSTALMIGLFLGLAALSQSRGKWRWLMLPYGVVMGAGLLTTGSRGAWVGVLAGLAVFALLLVARHWRLRPGRAILIGGGALVAGLLLVWGVYNVVGPATQARMDSVLDIGANQDRVRLYGTMLRLIQAHPLFGVGVGNIKHRFGEFREGAGGQVFGTAHNQLLQVLGEVGLFGLAFFLLLTGVWLIAAWPRDRAPIATLLLYSLLGGMFVRDLFDNTFTNFYIFFLINWLGGTLVGARGVAKSARSDSPEGTGAMIP